MAMQAVGQPEAPVAASFPPPPPFYKLYGSKAQASAPGGAVGDAVLSAPPPPPPPLTGPFQLYDREFDVAEPLVSTKPNSMIREAADGSIDYRAQLQQVCKELVPLYLELLRTLVTTPDASAAPLARVNTALAAAQHLINMARPDQARATLEYVLQLEVAHKQDTLRQLNSQIQALDSLLTDTAQQLVASAGPSYDDQPMSL